MSKVAQTPHWPGCPCEIQGCHLPANYECNWPVEIPVQVAAITLNVGDTWITQQNGKHGRVVDIEYFHQAGESTERRYATTLRIWVLLPGKKDPFPYIRPRFGGAGAIVPRVGVCRRLVCEQHVRELSDQRHYCAQHWRAWESV